MPLDDLLAPASRYAEEGFPVTEVIAGYWRPAERSCADPGRGDDLPARRQRAAAAGEVFKNPHLAAVATALIAEDGRDAFYKGRSPRRSSPSPTRSAACSR